MYGVQGFGEEGIEELNVFSLYIGVDFVKIAASLIIMSTIGCYYLNSRNEAKKDPNVLINSTVTVEKM